MNAYHKQAGKESKCGEVEVKRAVTLYRRIKARADAMKEAGTVCFAEFSSGKYFVVLVPTWINGRMYYREIAWTPFHERVGLGVTSNTRHSADCGLPRIFARARSALIN